MSELRIDSASDLKVDFYLGDFHRLRLPSFLAGYYGAGAGDDRSHLAQLVLFALGQNSKPFQFFWPRQTPKGGCALLFCHLLADLLGALC